MPESTRSVDAKLLGRKTFDLRVEMGAPFSADDRYYVLSRRPPPASMPAGVEFLSQPIGAFAKRLREQAGKNIWMMEAARSSRRLWTKTRSTNSSSASYRSSSGKAFTHRAKASRGAADAAVRETFY
jgi:dihydrofolate reductase